VKPERARVYSSPPRRPGSWVADRPGELSGPGQPTGVRLGYQGPDQGFALHLATSFEGQLQLAMGEREEDAIAGCVAVALKRASLFGRAPIAHDLRLAFTLFGYLGDPPGELIAWRSDLFEEVANPHHYAEQRGIVDLVPDETLRLDPSDVAGLVASDWRALLREIPVEPAPSVEELIREANVHGVRYEAGDHAAELLSHDEVRERAIEAVAHYHREHPPEPETEAPPVPEPAPPTAEVSTAEVPKKKVAKKVVKKVRKVKKPAPGETGSAGTGTGTPAAKPAAKPSLFGRSDESED
jgi:hypothetical protein